MSDYQPGDLISFFDDAEQSSWWGIIIEVTMNPLIKSPAARIFWHDGQTTEVAVRVLLQKVQVM